MLCNRRANPMHIANHTQKSLSPTELLSAACRAIDCAASRRTPFAARFEGDGSKETVRRRRFEGDSQSHARRLDREFLAIWTGWMLSRAYGTSSYHLAKVVEWASAN